MAEPQIALPFAADLPVQEKPEPFDVCANRHQGAETSVAANLVVDKEGQKRMIRSLLRRRKELCAHDIKKLTGWDLNRFSGRLTVMVEDGLITIVGHCDSHGTKARLYRLTDLGRQLAEQEARHK